MDIDYYRGKGLPEHYFKAMRVKAARAVKFDTPPGWNTDPALNGSDLRPFQRKGVAYLYLSKKSLLADQVGLGKTIQILALLQLLKSRGEPYRTVVVTVNGAQDQWLAELERFTDLFGVVAGGRKSERTAQYSGWWDVMITTYPQLLRDKADIKAQDFDVLVLDEASVFRHHNINTDNAVKCISRNRDRVYVVDATPVQKSLLDMHSILATLRLKIFGALPAFERRYIKRETRTLRGRGGAMINTKPIVGYKNFSEFTKRIYPFFLRRTAREVARDLPEVTTRRVWLTLPSRQQKVYDYARRGALVNIGENRVEAAAYLAQMQQALDSTYAFNDPKPQSVKLAWILRALQGDLAGEKVVIFSFYKSTIAHLGEMLDAAGIRYVRVTGDENNEQREEAKAAFRNDPATRVLVGTTAIERAINLQNAGYLICVNRLYNAQRMAQLIGRLSRIGSKHSRVLVLDLVIKDTHEERAIQTNATESALFDHVFGEDNTAIFGTLDEGALRRLIGD